MEFSKESEFEIFKIVFYYKIEQLLNKSFKILQNREPNFYTPKLLNELKKYAMHIMVQNAFGFVNNPFNKDEAPSHWSYETVQTHLYSCYEELNLPSNTAILRLMSIVKYASGNEHERDMLLRKAAVFFNSSNSSLMQVMLNRQAALSMLSYIYPSGYLNDTESMQLVLKVINVFGDDSVDKLLGRKIPEDFFQKLYFGEIQPRVPDWEKEKDVYSHIELGKTKLLWQFDEQRNTWF